MSGDFNISADASVNMTAGTAGAVGSGAYTLVVLFRPTVGNNNSGILWLDAAGAHQRSFFEDSLNLFGFNDFSSGFASLTQGNWYVVAQSKAAGSNLYRFHIWAYASDGSGTMTHGTEPGGASQGDGSTIDAIRIGIAEDRGNSLIAAVGLWTSALSDGQLDTLKSASLASWSALAPAELISLENWNGSTGATAVVGTSTQSSITGTVGVGANPPSFNFALTAASAGAAARPALPPHLLRLIAGRNQAQWQNTSTVQIDAQTGQVTGAAISTATAVKVAPATGRCAGAAFTRGTAAKTTAQTGAAATAAVTTGTAKKAAPQSSPATAAARTSGTAAKMAPATGNTPAVATSAGSLGAKAETGTIAVVAVSTAIATKVAIVSGRCAATGATLATAAKKATSATTSACGAGAPRATVVKRATPSSATLAATACRATPVKRATPSTSTQSCAASTGLATKRAQLTARAFAVAYSGQVDTTRQVTGVVRAAAISWSRRRITRRPNTGTTSRPNTGTTARPYTGITYRP